MGEGAKAENKLSTFLTLPRCFSFGPLKRVRQRRGGPLKSKPLHCFVGSFPEKKISTSRVKKSESRRGMYKRGEKDLCAAASRHGEKAKLFSLLSSRAVSECDFSEMA